MCSSIAYENDIFTLRAANQPGLKGTSESGCESHRAPRKHRDENETGKRKLPFYCIVLKWQSAFRDAPDQPEQLVDQD